MEVIGIDISKSTFDVWSKKLGHSKFSNDRKGFKNFIKLVEPTEHCVMEATGCYHRQLANCLYHAGVKVSVVNPLVIKRFIQMKMHKTKTDKSDSQMICFFGQEQQPPAWEPEPAFIEESKSLLSIISLFTKQSTQLKNKIQNLESSGTKRGITIRSLKSQLKSLLKQIDNLEQSLEELVKSEALREYSNLMSIPGIGKKTAILMLASTNMFRDFQTPRQVTSYVGLAPVERKSGTSIRGKSYISKMGSPILRNHLFLCSFTASQCNPQGKSLYDRITAKGTSKKSALVAVSNKLLRQAFGIIKSGIPYDPKYQGRIAA